MLKVQEIRELIKLIDESSIEDFTYETNGTTVSMKKTTGGRVIKTEAQPTGENRETFTEQSSMTEEAPVRPTQVENQEEPDMAPAAAAPDHDFEIVSPMVGTFYASPSPDSDIYVKNGSQVEESTIVCIVEAMKLFNEIEAETTGEIVEVLVDNGELVEFGQPLFRVKTK